MNTSRTAARLRITTIRALCAALLSGGALLGLCRDASAQFVFEEEVVPPRVVAWRLAEQGFTGLSRPRFNGRVYVVEAVSPAGMPMRLFVDPGSGGIVGRQRLGAPDTYARLERPAPGFGWTEEDAAPRRVLRPVPGEEAPALRLDRRSTGTAARLQANPDGTNPDGINPDSGRSTAPRKVARTAPTRNPESRAAHRTSPEAPAPKIAPIDAAKVEAKPDATPETKSAAIEKTPATNPASRQEGSAKPAAAVVAEVAKPAAKEWKDPPADKKPVRVIGGATIVPGPSEKEPAAAQ